MLELQEAQKELQSVGRGGRNANSQTANGADRLLGEFNITISGIVAENINEVLGDMPNLNSIIMSLTFWGMAKLCKTDNLLSLRYSGSETLKKR